MKQVILFFSCLFLLSMIIISCDDSSGFNAPSEESNTTEVVLKSIDQDGNINQITLDRSEIKPNRKVDTKRSGDDMASGHFKWINFDPESSFRWTHSFNAAGTATDARGQIEVKNNNSDFDFSRDHHGTILCTYTDGNENVTAYYIDNVKGDDASFAYQEGNIVWFRVIDNGEGNKAVPDEFYGIQWYCDADCGDGINPLTFEEAQEFVNEFSCQVLLEDFDWFDSQFPVSEGNIQVK